MNNCESRDSRDNFIKIVNSIIKEQNRDLLAKIATKYNKDYKILEQKYLTPTYYSTDINLNKTYIIKYIEK
jgi:hypothetical protein